MQPRPLEGKSREDLVELAKTYNWWHTIDLGGVVTKGVVGRWPLIARAFDQIDFTGKKVLDIGCWDGLWSFEAEKRGASEVYSVDYVSLRSWSEQPTYQLAHQLLGSKARYYPNLSVYDIAGLGVTDFDIVVYCGIYYHLLEPLRAFAALREVMKEGGLMIVEGPVRDGTSRVFADFYARTWFAEDPTNWWVPSMSCLREWLDCTCFDVTTEFSGKRDFAPPAPPAPPAPASTPTARQRLRSLFRTGEAVLPAAAPEAESEDRVSLIARATSIGERLAQRAKRQPLPPLETAPGITPEALAGFFAAASRFLDARPWQRIRHRRTIRLDAASLGTEPAFLMVLGDGNSHRGLVIFLQRPAVTMHLQGSLLGHLATWAGFLAVFLGGPHDQAAGEADAVCNDGHGYTPAEPVQSLRRPRASELQVLEACLRAVPAFIERHDDSAGAAENVSVPVAGGEVQMTLSWVTEGEREL